MNMTYTDEERAALRKEGIDPDELLRTGKEQVRKDWAAKDRYYELKTLESELELLERKLQSNLESASSP